MQINASYLASAAAAFSLLSGCKSEEAKTREDLTQTAQALCAVDNGGSPNVGALPPDLAKRVRSEDVEYATKNRGQDAGALPSATGSSGAPATCEFRSIDLQQTTAIAHLTRKVDGAVADYALSFVRTSDGWKADYHLPERNAVRASAHRLVAEATTLAEAYEWDKAKEKLLEAQKLAPEDADVKAAKATFDEVLATRVAGRWMKHTEKDAMTDKVNITMTLPASAEVSTGYAMKRPTLVARCVSGELDLVIQVEAVVDGDIRNNATARYRFDADAPQVMMMTTAKNHHGLFFRETAKWLDNVVSHAAGKLVVEIPIFGRVPQPVTFDLAGADVAIAPVKQACAK